MLYMVIESFNPETVGAVYQRVRDRGRMIPAGLEYINSWVSQDRRICYQLMSTDNPALFEEWIPNWSDLVSFEIVEVMTSADAAAEIMLPEK